jgi:glycosyltransferase involved in cell wall biosynthesis
VSRKRATATTGAHRACEDDRDTPRILLLTTRVADLEARLAGAELAARGDSVAARVRRLERDIATYRDARDAAEFKVTDLQAFLNHARGQIQEARDSPEYRLGAMLLEIRRDWRALLRLPRSFARWADENARQRHVAEGRLAPLGEPVEYTAAVERALALAEQAGIEAAERWALDQRFRGPVLARVLSDLAGFARRRDPKEAVRLARSALEADPRETRVKRLAFLMAEAGSLSEAAQLLRSGIATGANLNATEQKRAQNLFALVDLANTGLVLASKRDWVRPVGTANRRVLIYTAQAPPYHWSSITMRVHAMALGLAEGGAIVEVAAAPGYPDFDRADRPERPGKRNIEGIDYHLIPATQAPPSFGEDYIRQSSVALIAAIKRLDASVVIAPSDLIHGYPAAIASQMTGVALVLDCWRMAPREPECQTELGRITSRLEEELVRRAQIALARTPQMADRLLGLSGDARLLLVPDSTPQRRSATPVAESARAGALTLGYVGDAATDVDLESLAGVVAGVVARGIDARLVIYSVGSRVQAIKDSLELKGVGERIVIEGRPAVGQLERAYEQIDVVIVPMITAIDAIRSPYEVFAALRHGKCVVATGCRAHEGMLGTSIVYADDASAIVDSLVELAEGSADRRQYEDAAMFWARANESESALAAALEAL